MLGGEGWQGHSRAQWLSGVAWVGAVFLLSCRYVYVLLLRVSEIVEGRRLIRARRNWCCRQGGPRNKNKILQFNNL